MVALVITPPVEGQKQADPWMDGAHWPASLAFSTRCRSVRIWPKSKQKVIVSKEWQLRLSSGLHTYAPKCRQTCATLIKPAGSIKKEYPSKFLKLLWKFQTIPPPQTVYFEQQKPSRKTSTEYDQTVDHSEANTIRSLRHKQRRSVSLTVRHTSKPPGAVNSLLPHWQRCNRTPCWYYCEKITALQQHEVWPGRVYWGT